MTSHLPATPMAQGMGNLNPKLKMRFVRVSLSFQVKYQLRHEYQLAYTLD